MSELRKPPSPNYPPEHEVESLWRRARPVTQDPGVAQWLLERCIDPSMVAELDLARVANPDKLWPWAQHWAPGGHRVVVRLYDTLGALRSLIGRCAVFRGFGPKSLAPRGCKKSGLVFANDIGVQFLAQRTNPKKIYLFEGEMDVLTASVRLAGDAAEDPAAVIGIAQGSFSEELFRRLCQAEATIVTAFHDDPQGRRFTDELMDGLCRIGGQNAF